MPDTCQAGTCIGIKITCAAMDACHLAGACDPMVGCSNPQAPDGTLCGTAGATCNAGVCVMSSGNGGGSSGPTSASASSSGGVHFPQKTGGCGCGLAEEATSGGASASALLLALALRRRRRPS
jgi:MYXO-CTERM domain-containing protein